MASDLLVFELARLPRAGQEVPEGLADGRHRHRRHRHRARTRTEEDSARVARWRRDKERWQRFWARAQPREAPRRTGKLARLANLLRLGEGNTPGAAYLKT